MSANRWVSIIICTRNRAAALRKTLAALGRLRFPPEWNAELLVVDNGSTDETPMLVRSCGLGQMDVRYVFEPRKGLSFARNAGLAASQGEVILFTDDDVTPEEDWATSLMRPLLEGTCEAVTGQITLAPSLMRPWLTPMHRWSLGSSHDAKLRGGIRELIGANMGFRRLVLEKVPAFDTELGSGALGFAEETLFGWQLAKAGFRISYVQNAAVTHHLDPSRLRRSAWLRAAEQRGRTEAYLRYHWEHSDIRRPLLGQLYYFSKLQLRRIIQRPVSLENEGCALWEASYVLNMVMCEQFRLERRRPRNYERHGLTRSRPSAAPKVDATFAAAENGKAFAP